MVVILFSSEEVLEDVRHVTQVIYSNFLKQELIFWGFHLSSKKSLRTDRKHLTSHYKLLV